MIYELAGNQQAKFLGFNDVIVQYIVEDKIKNKVQLKEAFEYTNAHPKLDFTNKQQVEDFDKSVGVGLEYTSEDIQKYVDEYFATNLDKIKEKPYDKGLMNDFKEGLKFAD